MKHFHHVLFGDLHHRAIAHGGCGEQAESLPRKAPFSEKIALVQNAYRGFLPDLRYNSEFHLSFLYIKNSIRRVALCKDHLLIGKSSDLPAAVNGRKECLRIEFTGCLGRSAGTHNSRPLYQYRLRILLRRLYENPALFPC